MKAAKLLCFWDFSLALPLEKDTCTAIHFMHPKRACHIEMTALNLASQWGH